MKQEKSQEKIQLLQRSHVIILSTLANSNEVLRFKELRSHTEMADANISSALKALTSLELITKSTIGYTISEKGVKILTQLHILEQIHPNFQEIIHRTFFVPIIMAFVNQKTYRYLELRELTTLNVESFRQGVAALTAINVLKKRMYNVILAKVTYTANEECMPSIHGVIGEISSILTKVI
jgi:DNA-binding MarR family transcriptional regulator